MIEDYRIWNGRKGNTVTPVEIAQRVPQSTKFIISNVLCDTKKLESFLDHLNRQPNP